MRFGIVAPSSKVPAVEFELGLARIRAAGLEPVTHPNVLGGHLFFAGTDEERAQSVWDMALDPSIPALWCARGGYGSARILPLLDRLAKKRRAPVPRKLLAGFSDSTALLEYVRTRWGWSTLHAPMPGLRQFCLLPESEFAPLISMIRGEPTPASWKLRFWGRKPLKPVSAQLVGGNLSVWASLIGTPYACQARGKIAFLEDVDENLYRVDRMVQQLLASGSLRGARALVLGNFAGCRDLVPQVLSEPPSRDLSREEFAQRLREPDPSGLSPLRPTMEPDAALEAIFSEVSRALKIPVAHGLPVGHGPGKAPLPLGARYELGPRGEFKLLKWDWKR
jgi:muramoyltetrapeptide carboxypeptidase